MKDYENLLTEGAYQLNLEGFKNIPFTECENNLKFFSYLCYYEKTDILKYCIEHPKYNRLIKDKELLDDYSISISLEKGNLEWIDYLLENNYITKDNLLKNIDGFLMGNTPLNYLPEINQENVKILGNKSIYHVKESALLLSLQKGFTSELLELESFYFCIKNTVALQEKNKVLKLVKENINISSLIAQNKEYLYENKIEIDQFTQSFETVIEIIFEEINVKEFSRHAMKCMLKLIEVEKKIKTNYLQNKVLLEVSNDFSKEDLQKIKKFNKDFYREIEKVRLYQSLQEKENLNLAKSQLKRNKI